MRLRFFLFSALAGGLLASPAAHGQAPIPAATARDFKVPVYDAVAIKPNKTGSGNISIHTSNGTYTATNVTLKILIAAAFDVREGLVTGLPGWGDSAHWDIKAKVTEPETDVFKNLKRADFRAMLMPIVTDRFHVQAHRETKTLPVYELVVAKEGAKIKENPRPPPATDEKPQPKSDRGSVHVHNTDMTVIGIPMSTLAAELSDILDRTVIDKTGLTSEYDFELKWTPDDKITGTDNGSADAPPGIFTALQEQLGLKLVSGKGPVETLVVDRAELPAED